VGAFRVWDWSDCLCQPWGQFWSKDYHRCPQLGWCGWTLVPKSCSVTATANLRRLWLPFKYEADMKVSTLGSCWLAALLRSGSHTVSWKGVWVSPSQGCSWLLLVRNLTEESLSPTTVGLEIITCSHPLSLLLAILNSLPSQSSPLPTHAFFFMVKGNLFSV
jgi:hypothetical protein